MIQTATQQMLAAVNQIVGKARQIHDGIPETIVVLGASGVMRNGQKHGHFAPKSWKSRKSEEVYGEILLSGESLSRGAVDTLGTILHELTHAYCYANDVKDTSNNARYHNSKFRDKAEEFGLSIEKADTIGWSVTSVPKSTQEVYKDEIAALEDAIIVHRGSFKLFGDDEEDKPKKQKKRKMQCPSCEEPLLVTLKWWENVGEYNIRCDRHDEYFEIFEEVGDD